MNNQSLVLVEKIDPKIVVVSLNRKEKRNALNISLLEALSNALDEIKKDSKIRVMILKGEGSNFCSGLDLKEASDIANVEKSSHFLAKVLSDIYKSFFVTIALVQGSSLAGGAGLMSACDFVLAEPSSLFGYPEVKRGLVAALVMTILKKQLQQRHIKELLLLGELINAEKALSIGLIDRIVEPQNLMSEALKIAEIVINNGPQSIAKSKQFLDSLSGNFSEDLELMKTEGIKIRSSQEAKEGISAYLENRPPNFNAQ